VKSEEVTGDKSENDEMASGKCEGDLSRWNEWMSNKG